MQAECPTKQAHVRDSGEMSAREHDNVLTVQHALSANNDNGASRSRAWYIDLGESHYMIGHKEWFEW